jgi:hypothetical protein
MNSDPVLSYESRRVHISKAAMAVFWLSLVAAAGFIFLLPAVVMLIVSFFTRLWMAHRPHLEGRGYAVWGTRLSASGCFLGLCTWVVLSTGSRNVGITAEAHCAANLRGIAQSMAVYANDNSDMFPAVTAAPYFTVLNNASGTATALSATDAINNYFRPPFPQAGSPQACLWIMVLNNQIATKSLICKTDSRVSSAALLQDGPGGTSGRYFDNFQDGHQLSYSIAYPWKSDGTVGAWWKYTDDASLPLLSDMAPEQGTGTPPRNLISSPLTKDANSLNHKGDGQNVAFADAHVDFTRLPNVGHGDDNIFTTSGSPSRGPAATGGLPASKSPQTLTATAPPFDIVMLPIRNETTGGF